MSFRDKQSKLIAILKDAEERSSYVSNHSKPEESSMLRSRRVVGQARKQTHFYRGKESIFKRPEAPLAACLPFRKLPDYVKNPDNWTHYNLENVPEVSERSNAEAAAMCRRDMLLDINIECDIEENTKIEFKPPILLTKELKPKAIEYKNTVVVYPEHVVGQSSRNKRIKREAASRCHTKPVLMLDHLVEDDDED